MPDGVCATLDLPTGIIMLRSAHHRVHGQVAEQRIVPRICQRHPQPLYLVSGFTVELVALTHPKRIRMA